MFNKILHFIISHWWKSLWIPIVQGLAIFYLKQRLPDWVFKKEIQWLDKIPYFIFPTIRNLASEMQIHDLCFWAPWLGLHCILSNARSTNSPNLENFNLTKGKNKILIAFQDFQWTKKTKEKALWKSDTVQKINEIKSISASFLSTI